MTAAEMDVRILDLLSEYSSTGGSNFTSARRLRALNEQYDVLCTQKELGIVEQHVGVGSSYSTSPTKLWDYDYPTPSNDPTIARPLEALQSVAGFVAIKKILNQQGVILGQPVVLKKMTYEWITDKVYRYPYLTYPFPFIFWANRPTKRGYCLYPVPTVSYTPSNSPLAVQFVARPQPLTGAEDETSIILPVQYHPMLCKFATAALLKSIRDDAWVEQNREAEVMLSEFVAHDNENLNQLVSHGVDKRVWKYGGRY